MDGLLGGWASSTPPARRSTGRRWTGPPRTGVSLPTYPFQRQTFPIERSSPARPGAGHQPEYPLLGRRLPTALPATLFETAFSDAVPLLRDHSLYGTLVVPGAAFLAMALQAAEAAFGRGACVVEGVAFREPLLLEDRSAYTVQTILNTARDGAAQWEVFSSRQPEGEWRLHSGGVIRSECRRRSGTLRLA